MSSMLNSQGMALATAMAAVSGTVILLSFCIQKSIPTAQFSIHHAHPFSPPALRSCIPSETRKKEKKKKKRVHFADDVVDPIGNGEDFRRHHEIASDSCNSTSSSTTPGASPSRGMPANRLALYNGILRDRVVHRLAYS